MATNPFLSPPTQKKTRKVIITLPRDMKVAFQQGSEFSIMMAGEQLADGPGDSSPSPPRKESTGDTRSRTATKR